MLAGRKLMVLALLVAASLCEATAQQCISVRDADGLVIATAMATATASGQTFAADAQGQIQVPQEVREVTVSADGFGRFQVRLTGESECLTVTLGLLPRTDYVVVTPNRAGLKEASAPESVVTIDSQELRHSAALSLDDTLRSISGFTLFRRTSSLVSNPTSQGVSLRGVGASGASRALVLLDDVPMNDPFGGWVYWSRMPKSALESVEVLRGGGSHLYGSSALSGVVAITPRHFGENYVAAEISAGNLSTRSISAELGLRKDQWSAHLSASGFETGGYVLTEESQRGAVDVAADSRSATGTLRLDHASKARHFFGSVNVFNEGRLNGTPLQTNATRLIEGSAGWDEMFKASSLQARVYGSAQHYDQSFTAVAADRDSETVTRAQDVPAQQVGGSIQWFQRQSESFGFGADFRIVRGVSDELAFVGGNPNRFVASGGRQRSGGAYVRKAGYLGVLRLSGSLRVDGWQNYRGFAQTAPLAAPFSRTRTELAKRNEMSINPQGGILLALSEKAIWTASAYRAFRAPMLNELYRGFRVGNVQTNANEALKAEKLTGAESSLRFYSRKVRATGTFFWSRVNDPITNRTLSVTPSLITRQRANLGASRSLGIEVDGEAALTTAFTLRASYQFAHSTFTNFAADRTLEGKRLPQTPRQSVSVTASYLKDGSYSLSLQLRAADSQFEDDRNLFVLDPYTVVDLFASKNIHRNVSAFLAIENIGNLRYKVGVSPVTQLSTPVMGRIGLRFWLTK